LRSFFCIFENPTFAQDVYRIQRGQRGYTPPPTPIKTSHYDEKRDANSIANEQLPVYAEALQLDDFQKELVKNMIVDHYTKREVIRTNYEMNFGDKQDAYVKLEEEFHRELSTVLSEEQVAAFKKVEFLDNKEQRKEEKRKKKKKKKNFFYL